MKNTLKLLFFIAIIGCKSSTKKNIEVHSQLPSNAWQTLFEPSYTIKYPSKWEIVKGGDMPLNAFFSPKESTEDKFQENVNVLIQSLPEENIDLDKYSDISEREIKTMLTNAVIIESKRIKDNSQNYHKLIYTGDQGIYHLKFEQYFYVNDSKAYVITFTSEQDKFANYKEIGENILNSFKLK